MKRVRELAGLLLVFSGVACASQASAPDVFPPGSEPLPWKDAMKVHELLYLDTEHALRLAHDRRRLSRDQSGSATSLPTSPLADDQPQVQAIYGVGSQLYAQILHRGQSMIFAKGLLRPVGASAGQGSYRLLGITGRCVRLKVEQTEHTLCVQQERG